MKSSVMFAITAISLSTLVSCESIDSKRGGGGAFSDSPMARNLDANSHLSDPENPVGQSHEDWLELQE